MAFTAGFNSFRQVYNNPSTFYDKPKYEAWDSRYNLLWSYYISSVMDTVGQWTAYRSERRLYRFTRPLYNPTRRLVDFYAGTIYPGVLTADARRFEDGTVIAVPFSEDTPRRLTQAIASLWKWSNWHINKTVMVRYTADLGESMVEIIDDMETDKIEFQVRHPSLVRDLTLDFRGNVKAYTIEYQYTETVNGTDHTYTYRKEVSQQSFDYFRDGKPYNYGQGTSVPNPYGFVPAVWVKHVDVGTDHGEPCMRNMSKWDELFALASHTLDQVHRVLEAPILISGENVQTLKTDLPEGAQMDGKRPDAGRSNIPILTGPLGSRMDVAQPPSGEALNNMTMLITEIEKDHPELTMHHEMRRMSQVTGPAVTRLFGDVDIMVNEARQNYDTQSIKLFQMGVAMGGMRANNGDWGSDLSADREVFLPFDLSSYEDGELDFEIADRPLVPLGRWETVQVMRAELALKRELLLLKQTQTNPLGTESSPGLPSGDQANQIAQRLRMRSSTEGVMQTATPPTP